MVAKRKPIHQQVPTMAQGTTPASQLNFRPGGLDAQRNDSKGTRPTATPTTVREVMVMMIMYLCKKTLFFDVNLKVALYMISLFLISLIGDFVPYPKSYFARSDNLFNVYFVKMGWAWTLLFSIPFMFMTASIICCGNQQRIIKNHLTRILIATGFWFGWTKLFNIIENSNGWCNVQNYHTKSACLKAGYFWKGFDISGHAFILIYSSLILIEEARPIINWECIKEHIRNEEHNRMAATSSSGGAGNSSSTTSTTSTTINPLRNLNDREIKSLKSLYERYTPAIRTLFIGMSVLQVLWDIMLVGTMLYYHNMLEKVLSGIFAILTWFFTYRAWYPKSKLIPDLPGQGLFNYQRNTKLTSLPLRRRASLIQQQQPSNSNRNDIPKFMGMPLYGLNAQYQQQQSQPATQYQPKGPSSYLNTENFRYQD